MQRATRKERSIVVNIITESFQYNPGTNWMFSPKSNRVKDIKRLAEYAFMKCYNRNGILISTNGKGVALFYRSDKKSFSLRELYYEIKFGLLSIQITKLKNVLQREAYRKSKRPQNEPYYYFWFLAVLKEGASAGFELNRRLIEIANNEQIPIYLETSIERNKLVYERIGYETYDYWEDDTKGIKTWFLKRQAS